MWARSKTLWTRQHRKRRSGALIVPAISAVFLSYFAYQAFHGEFGIYSRYKLTAEANVLQTRLDAIRERREKLEKKVDFMKDGAIERDMLDEQARAALDLARPDEVIILRHPIKIANWNQVKP